MVVQRDSHPSEQEEADQLWQQQAQWRTANPYTWWTGIPDAWR
jgi:hypothetical protein